MASKKTAPRKTTAKKKEPLDLTALDRAAGRALRDVDEGVPSQRAAIKALAALEDACAKGSADGVLAREVGRLLVERKSAMRAFHLDRVARALDRAALAGSTAHEDARRALEDALDLISFIDGESATLRTLREKLHDVKKGMPGTPRPFFARYLEHQER